ncbi:uncharacterized protein B0H18DRAFT_1215006 [Fomitopsis serialis]|nr:uncharacterized protein B0H18DRAFT_1215006 [Neoantrodia serialis]KAH9916690.1 hypothetical protein B0H18DRAFT_1215006 [Neoantrodia serialis]
MRLLLSSLIALCITAWAAPVLQGTSELAVRDFWPRAPHDIDLTLDGQKYKVRKNELQGVHGVVYQVVEGKFKGGYAKTKISDDEIHATSDVGALWKFGFDEHHEK